MVRIVEIDYLKEFPKLKDSWNKLATCHHESSPFLSWEWYFFYVYPFLLKSGGMPIILAAKNEEKFKAFLPLVMGAKNMRNIQLQTLQIATCPDTFFNGLIADETAHVLELLEYCRQTYEWDILILNKIRGDSTLGQAVQFACDQLGLPVDIVASTKNLFVTINKQWPEYYKGRSKLFRKSLRGVENRLKRNWPQELLVYSNSDDRFEIALKKAYKVSSNSWKHKEGLSVVSNHALAEAFAGFFRVGVPGGETRIYILELDRNPVAVQYDILQNGVEYALRADFDEGWKQWSPGTYLDYKILESLFHNGIQRYELGPGLNSYKLRWTNDSYDVFDYRIYNNKSKKALMLQFLENRIIPAARRMKHLFQLQAN